MLMFVSCPSHLRRCTHHQLCQLCLLSWPSESSDA